jgi:hypothetical protein
MLVNGRTGATASDACFGEAKSWNNNTKMLAEMNIIPMKAKPIKQYPISLTNSLCFSATLSINFRPNLVRQSTAYTRGSVPNPNNV